MILHQFKFTDCEVSDSAIYFLQLTANKNSTNKLINLIHWKSALSLHNQAVILLWYGS